MTNAEIIASLTHNDKRKLMKGLEGKLTNSDLNRNLVHYGLVAFHQKVILSPRGKIIAQLIQTPPANEVSIHEED